MGNEPLLKVILDSLMTITLGSSFLIIGGRRLESAIKVIIAQAVLLAGITVVMGMATGEREIFIAAVLTIIIKAGVIPVVLQKVVARIGVCREVKSYVNMKMSFVACAGLVIVSYYVSSQVIGIGAGIARSALPAAISMILIGAFVMISRKMAVMQIVGLMVMENGLYLAGVGTTHGMPLVVELGIFLDILVGALIMGILAFRINRTFDTIDTEYLKNLRG